MAPRCWPQTPVETVIAISGLFLALILPLVGGCQGRDERRVTAYVAQDQVYAEPLLARFEAAKGGRVAAVFDSEAVKTVGLANRLLAERDHPQCDVFWGNEELRTRQLAARGVWRGSNGWAAFGYRSRRLIINTNFLDAAPDSGRLSEQASAPVAGVSDDASGKTRLPAPRSLSELTNAVWRGKVALAYPLFGTTAAHFLALRQYWGPAAWESWCRALAANRPLVVDGNSVVARLVARGEAWIGLTDSDDILAVLRESAPVAALPLGPEFLLIPNTVAIPQGAPHPVLAEALFQFLQRHEVAQTLVEAGALEGISPTGLGMNTLKPDWDGLLADMDTANARLKEIFLR